MVNQRVYIIPTRKTYELKLRSRFYPISDTKAFQTVISTRCSPNPARQRFPFAESVFSSATLQPYIHDVEVAVQEHSHTYRYRVFFKRHCRLQANASLMALDPELTFKGDAMVMRVGSRGNLVNMRDRDTILSDYIITRIAQIVSLKKRGRLPRFMHFCKE